MRAYDLTLTNADGSEVWAPDASGNLVLSTTATTTFTSRPSSRSPITGVVAPQNDPGALQIEFDIPVAPRHVPQGGSYIKISGVGLRMLTAKLAGARFTLKAGMAPGLPLATAAARQYGLICQGQVFQSIGNWEGVDQYLTLIILAGDLEPQGGFVLNWKDGQPLDQALSECLAPVTLPQGGIPAPYQLLPPQIQPTIGVGQCAGPYTTFSRLAEFIEQRTAAPNANPPYTGVKMSISGNSISIYDFPTIQSSPPKQLLFQDLIGQPVWVGANQINFATVLRADIDVADRIKFPDGIKAPFALTSQAAAQPNNPASNSLNFQGSFSVQELHHFANFRGPNGSDWISQFVVTALGPNS